MAPPAPSVSGTVSSYSVSPFALTLARKTAARYTEER
jgi:hypothetical protein